MDEATTGAAQPVAATGLRNLVPLILLAVMWGGSIPAIKLGLDDLPPLTLTFLRYLSAAPLFLWSLRQSWPALRQEWRALAMLAFLNAVPGQLLQTVGVRYTTATAGTILTATIPAWFVVLASRQLGQRLGWRQGLGLGAALLGVGVIAVGDPHQVADLWRAGLLLGNGLILLCALSVALYYALSADLARRVSPLVTAGGTSLFAVLYLLPFSLWELRSTPLQLTGKGVGVVLYLAVIVTWLGLQIWFTSLQRVPASIAGVLQYLQPVVGVAISALILREALEGRVLLGAALILVGIALVTRPVRRAVAIPSKLRQHVQD